MSISLHTIAQSAIALVSAITLTDALREGINHMKPSSQLYAALYRVLAVIFILIITASLIYYFKLDKGVVTEKLSSKKRD